MRPNMDDWADLAARYQYMAERKAILTRLGMKE